MLVFDLNDLATLYVPDGVDVVVIEGVSVVADGLASGAVQRVVRVHRQPVKRGTFEPLRPEVQ